MVIETDTGSLYVFVDLACNLNKFEVFRITDKILQIFPSVMATCHVVLDDIIGNPDIVKDPTLNLLIDASANPQPVAMLNPEVLMD